MVELFSKWNENTRNWSDFCSCEAIITPKTEVVNTFLKYFWKNFSNFGKIFSKTPLQNDFSVI